MIFQFCSLLHLSTQLSQWISFHLSLSLQVIVLVFSPTIPLSAPLTHLQSLRRRSLWCARTSHWKNTSCGTPLLLESMWEEKGNGGILIHILGGHCQANGFLGTGTFWQRGEETKESTAHFWHALNINTIDPEKTSFFTGEMEKREDIVLYCKQKCSDGRLNAYLRQQKRKV